MASDLAKVLSAKQAGAECMRTAVRRSEFCAAADQYQRGANICEKSSCSEIRSKGLHEVMRSNQAEALLRAGLYEDAKEASETALEICTEIGGPVHVKSVRRLARSKRGLALLDGDIGDAFMAPPIPDEWFTQPPGSGVNRVLWGWRSKFEVAVRSGDAQTAAAEVQMHDIAELRSFSECNILLNRAAEGGHYKVACILVDEVGVSVDGLHSGAPPAVEAVRIGRGYLKSTPLYAAAQGENGNSATSPGRSKIARLLLQHGADPVRIFSIKEMVPYANLLHTVFID